MVPLIKRLAFQLSTDFEIMKSYFSFSPSTHSFLILCLHCIHLLSQYFSIEKQPF